MKASSSSAPIGGSRKMLFDPGSEFTPKPFEAKTEVLKTGFVTQAVPSVPNYAGVIGICAVPEEKAGMDDLGWHIADFLAFRALLCGDNKPRAQSWLSMCDIAALVRENPERYVHGNDRRLVGSAATPEKYQTQDGLVEREDNIEVETSAEALKDKFVAAIKKKLKVLRAYNYPLLLIICGATSLEQDIYLGQIDIDHRYTMKDLRQDLGDDIDHIDATVVTPSLFSAGWQVNTSFGRFSSTNVRGSRDDFLARQFGALFARHLVPIFLGWQCPAIDEAKLDPQVKSLESFPGPVQPSNEVKALTSQLEIEVHSCLLGELSACQRNHSFSFHKDKDEWNIVINSREAQHDGRSLDWYERKWRKLPSGHSPESAENGFAFLGNAFGGTRVSQLNHIKYLIEESYLAWPDLWSYTWGQETKKQIERFKVLQNPDSLDCQEIFYVLEHRARMSILGDTIVQYFDLPMPTNERCRDCNNHTWKQQLPETVRSSLIKHFGMVLASVPGPNVPPGVNLNSMNKLQRRLESCTAYIQASLAVRFLTSKDSSKGAVDLIDKCRWYPKFILPSPY
ncbi:hypothetical protein F5Y08DRAFT_243882 [Xylaria arbuscula]|nr:hypothetical protein F5Y08DRAFT_243882 [Xylaria arbuscula]